MKQNMFLVSLFLLLFTFLQFVPLSFPKILYFCVVSRILSIDYGRQRTGIAVTDTSQIIAQGLTTVNTDELMPFIVDYVGREPVERIVVGYPRQTNGEDSENAARVKTFMNQLRKHLPQIPLESFDERFTSVLAHKAMLDSGVHKKTRREKVLVDKISATIILQDYLERRRLISRSVGMPEY